MKFSLVIVLLATLPAFGEGFEPCKTNMTNAVKTFYASQVGVTPNEISVLNANLGAWTEMVGDNHGTGHVTVAFRRMRGETFRVSMRQIGTSSDCRITGITQIQENE